MEHLQNFIGDCDKRTEIAKRKLKETQEELSEEATAKVWISADFYSVECCYNTVNFLTNIHKRHPIACTLGRGMGCLLWIHYLIDILPQFL